MIDIYTEKKDSKDWIFQNDLYFNLNTSNEEMSQYEINLIRQVDEAKLTPDKHIETKYGLGTIRNLSSGCKTLLNIVKHPDKVVNVEECGPNVLKIIFTMDNIKIYMSRPTLFDIPDDVQIRFNESDIVTGGKGYNAWWGKEYERREADDFSELIEQCRDSFIVVDNADNLINDEVRRFINFESSNQYMLFLRNCDGLNVSDNHILTNVVRMKRKNYNIVEGDFNV